MSESAVVAAPPRPAPPPLPAPATRYPPFCLAFGFVSFHVYPPLTGHRLQSGAPDVRCSLLHQKLQLLHCCIERKRARSLALLSASAKATDASGGDGDASDDEFFECAESAEGESAQPTGRLEALELTDEEKQLVGGQSPIFVPVTQEQAPLTEDTVEQNTSILEKWAAPSLLHCAFIANIQYTRMICMPLWPLCRATEQQVRMKLQCAGTLSDMRAFKAANPGAPFEYFLRWFSPADVQFAADRCPPGRLLYQLSPRMQLPGSSHILLDFLCRPSQLRSFVYSTT